MQLVKQSFGDVCLAAPAMVVVGSTDASRAVVPVFLGSDEASSDAVVSSVAVRGGARGGHVGEVLSVMPFGPDRTLRSGGRVDAGARVAACLVQIDLGALGLADGESSELRIAAEVVDGAKTRSANARMLIAVSALPAPAGGWIPGDTHVHTRTSDGWVDLPLVCSQAKAFGLKWLVITDHWSGIRRTFPGEGSYIDYAAKIDRQVQRLQLPIGAGVEWSSTSRSHILGYRLPRAAADAFPTNSADSPQRVVDTLERLNPNPLSGGAHPDNRWYPWVWSTVGNDTVELMTSNDRMSERIRVRWFEQLRHRLGSGLIAGVSPRAPVGVASSDSHGLAGLSSITWARTPSGRMTGIDALWNAMQAGACVASGAGDFARAELRTTAGGVVRETGVGEIAVSGSDPDISFEVHHAARTHHTAKTLDIWRIDASSKAVPDEPPTYGPFAIDTANPMRVALPAPAHDCCYVAVVHFSGSDFFSAGRYDVVCNPIWVAVSA